MKRSDFFDAEALENVAAELAKYNIPPVTINGVDSHVVFLQPKQSHQLREMGLVPVNGLFSVEELVEKLHETQ